MLPISISRRQAEKIFPFLAWLPLVNRKTLKADLMAGLTGAVIVLPQGVAFSTIAGLPPQYGLYTAMVTPIIAALFGSSFHLISGPTTAISIVIFSAASNHAAIGSPEFVTVALTLTFLAGVYQLVFGLARMGMAVNFVSHTVVIGFTAGAAILIITSQMKHVLGLDIEKGGSFLHIWQQVFAQLDQANIYNIVIALVTLATALLSKKFFPKLPNLLIALIAGSLFSIAIAGAQHGVQLIGEIPAQLPPLSSPDFSLDSIRELAPEAFAIALLGLIEAVSISRAVATKSRQPIDANQEFIGQGLSNIVGSFFSSYAGSGSFTRTGVNYEAGAKTPMSAIFAAISLMLIILLIAPLTAYLPMPAMAGVILLVAYNLVDFHHISKILRISKSETSVLLVTFFATLFLELEFAIYMGVLLSLIIFLMRTSTPEIVTMAPDPNHEPRRLREVSRFHLKQCPQLKIIRINMSIYFGSVDHIQKRLRQITDDEGYKYVLILGRGINFIDMSGAEMMVEEANRFKELGGGLFYCGVKPNVCNYLKATGFAEEFGETHLFEKKDTAIRQITEKWLDHSLCETCSARIFHECKHLPGGEIYNKIKAREAQKQETDDQKTSSEKNPAVNA